LSQLDKNIKTCSFCGAEEGKPRPLGRFIVELTEVGDEWACQSCKVHHNEEFPNRDLKKSWWEKMKKKWTEK
jgi:hypothetical protein